ncbi:MAG: TIGR02186 family protein [Hyphomicrobium sp.]|jgi:uncharacterized protein (TIGR02186 family)|nr:TIGR02186 family protein [Hyphomicrobium sp.]
MAAALIAGASILAAAVAPIALAETDVAQLTAKSKRKVVVEPPAVTDTQLPAERVEADVSTRTIAITSGYSGSEILVFGAIENSRQPSAESGFYDVAVVVEGAPEPLMVRKKGRIGGLWVNTSTFNFNSVPSYYAVASTRPLEEFASPALLDDNGIGLDAVRMAPAADSAVRVSSEDLIAFKDAVRRLKQSAQLFKRDDYGVIFTGRSLFRSTIALPATVPVGPLSARVFLFQDGKLLSRYQARVVLEREGIERWLYAFAMDRPFLYGLVAVLLAVATGLVASALFRRRLA